jgi:tellurite resistance protein TerC
VTTLDIPYWAWFVLVAVVFSSLTIDLLVHRGSNGQGRRSAVLWSVGWIAVSLAFGGWLAIQFGRETAQDYLAAYLVEKSLSIDNLFVFLVVFTRLRIPETEQHRVLSWGIIGAFATRGAFIAAGSAILTAWHGVVYILGAFLVYTGVKTAIEHHNNKKEDREEGKVFAFVRKHLPFTPHLDGHHFITIENGKRVGTPLLLALIVIEFTDIVFAVDSIPAVFAITEEPFIVYSSNVFAILGMRALYLVLADVLNELKYLHYGLAGILVFAGAKMLVSDLVHVPHVVSLLVVVLVLVAVTVPSLLARRQARRISRAR